MPPGDPDPAADGVEGGDPYSPGQWQGGGVVEQAVETDPAATKPRSGRNLPLATAVGLVLLGAAALQMYLAAAGLGMGRDDDASLARVYALLSGASLPTKET